MGAGERNFLEMAVVGAAAASEHRQVGKLATQRGVAPAEIGRIADVEIARGVELGVTARRCVRPQAAQARDPCFAFAQRIGECVGCAQLSM